MSWTRAAASRGERGPTLGNQARAAPLWTCPVRDDGWKLRDDACRWPAEAGTNQVVLLLRRRSTLAASVVALYTSHSPPRALKARLGTTLASAVTERTRNCGGNAQAVV